MQIKLSKDAETVVFTGVGLSLYINEILEYYPAATLYLVKNSNGKLNYNPEFKEELLMLVEDITEEWIYDTNNKINFVIEEFEKNKPLSWKIVEEIPETPMVAKL
jgi:hypothetical protein